MNSLWERLSFLTRSSSLGKLELKIRKVRVLFELYSSWVHLSRALWIGKRRAFADWVHRIHQSVLTISGNKKSKVGFLSVDFVN